MGILIMEKKHYLAIIRKAAFIDLFKYGHLYVSQAVPFDGSVKAHAGDTALFESLTRHLNTYEYSFEYLIIHFLYAGDSEDNVYKVDIRDVQGIYTFDEEARREMAISFDPRIELRVSPWARTFARWQQHSHMAQSLRGVQNLWTIFDLPSEDMDKCSKIITPEIVSEVFRELYANQRPCGNQSLWTYLLRYERHSFYPRDMRGFFCDTIHVVCNWKMQGEVQDDDVARTEIYPWIIGSNAKADYSSLAEVMQSSPLAEFTEKETGCRFVWAAPLFLYLKSEFVGGMVQKPSKKFISYLKTFNLEGSLAVYLLGLTLGQDKTYDAFYEEVRLPIFKEAVFLQKQEVVQAPVEQQPVPVVDVPAKPKKPRKPRTSKSKAEPELKAEPETPKVEEQPKAEAGPVATEEPKVEEQPEVKVEPEPVATGESKVEEQPEPEPEPEPESPKVKEQPKADPKSELETPKAEAPKEAPKPVVTEEPKVEQPKVDEQPEPEPKATESPSRQISEGEKHSNYDPILF